MKPTESAGDLPIWRHTPRTRTEHRYLTIDEVQHFANTINPSHHALVYIGALAGHRPGELAALHIDDIDFLRRTLRVECGAPTPLTEPNVP